MENNTTNEIATLQRLQKEIDDATSSAALDDLEKKIESLPLSEGTKGVAKGILRSKMKDLQNQMEILQNQMEISQKSGLYFIEASQLWDIKSTELPSGSELMVSFDKICRAETPPYYESIVRAACTENKKGKPNEPNIDDSVATNSEYPKPKRDIFNCTIGIVRARILLDSNTCAPGWALMAEGATGKITIPEGEGPTNNNKKKKGGDRNENEGLSQEKNRMRLLRMMGSKTKVGKDECLRQSIRNYLPLQSNQRTYYGGEPQLLIIPILTLEDIKEWDGKKGYDALVLAAKSPETGLTATAQEIYRLILPNYDWEEFNGNWYETEDGKKNPAVCETKDIETALASLRAFIEALAHTLVCGIPQELIKLAKEAKKKGETMKNTNSKGNKNHDGDLESEDEQSEVSALDSIEDEGNVSWNYDPLLAMFKNDGVPLPYLKTGFVGHVLKVRFDDGIIPILPDLWLLMVKAGVNYSFIQYGHKLLPFCKPPPHESVLQYEEALRRHEQYRRQQDIPIELGIPVSPGGSSVGSNELSDPSVATSDKGIEGEESNSWEYLDD